jgi:hypothetical protein
MYAYHRHQNALAVQPFIIKCVSTTFRSSFESAMCNPSAVTISFCGNLCFFLIVENYNLCTGGCSSSQNKGHIGGNFTFS